MKPHTVQELIEVLQTYPKDALVHFEWEGTTHTSKLHEYDPVKHLVIFDVEYDSYMDEIERN